MTEPPSRPIHPYRWFFRRIAVVGAALTATISLSAGSAAASGGSSSRDIRLNHLQVIGSHNSYHIEPNEAEFGLISLVAGATAAGALQYTHPPLDEQFDDEHVRQIELDVYADPEGGRYATPLIRRFTGQSAEFDPDMKAPGTKVLHISDIDYRSNCVSFVACLKTVRTWSHRHPRHVPVAILVEFKDTLDVPIPGVPLVPPLPWTRDRMLDLEKEIRSVFPRRELITPDHVRRPGQTLERSVLRHGWPTLAASRGKVMFLMDNDGAYRDRYIEGNPSLQGRVLFTNSTPGRPDAAFVKRNDPVASAVDIRALVEQGYVVRTRADADTVQARSGDTTARDAALAGGAQWVSTDYPVPGIASRFGTDYFAALPGLAAARCNPVTAPPRCRIPSP
ncbi:MAG TPA: phosphatidylinositol-specific phospholipase C1-like protein [Streptosporangiaceae bacterium]|nr:phosphatidylinositol-specific phospholipase C1-like protein [Streptosporangiaceae bacterium]